MNKISRYYACAVIDEIEKEVDYQPSVMQMTSFLKMLITEPEDRVPSRTSKSAASFERPITSELMTGILKAVSVETTFTVHDLVESKRRFRDLTDARHILRFLCRDLTSHSFERIGAHLHCDHNSVIQSCEAVKALMETNGEFSAKVKALRENIRAQFDGHPELKRERDLQVASPS